MNFDRQSFCVAILFIIILLGSFVGTASAAYGVYKASDINSKPTIRVTGGFINVSDLHGNLYLNSYAPENLDTSETIIKRNANGSYTFNGVKYLYNLNGVDFTDSTIYSNHTENLYVWKGDHAFENTTLYGCEVFWNPSTNGKMLDWQTYNAYGGMYCEDQETGLYVHDIVIDGFTNGFRFGDKFDSSNILLNSRIENITVSNTTNLIFHLWKSNNNTLNNITISNPTLDHTSYIADYQVFVLNGVNNTVTNVNIEGGHDSNFRLQGSDSVAENIVSWKSGHNGFDIGGINQTLKNISANDSTSNGIHITTGTASNYQPYTNPTQRANPEADSSVTSVISIYDATVKNSVGVGYYPNHVYNTYLENFTSTDNGGRINLIYVCNTTVINASVSNTGEAAYDLAIGNTGEDAAAAIDTTVIDSYFEKAIILYQTDNVRLVNLNVTGMGVVTTEPQSYSVWYHPKVRVVNPQGQPVSGAAITSNTTALNGYGIEQTTFYTGDDGYIDYSNRSNSMAIMDYTGTNSSTTQVYSTLTASKDDQSDSISNVDPDATWYNLGGDEIVLTLDVEGTGGTETPTFTVTTFIVSSFIAASLAVSSFLNRRRK